ncbi:hypothetical protein [Aquimarina megaterium]|uniref:hypothetical protein n=1 Tax=Aquimarina megaterium TaxID=1443666 RepID=UPI0004727F2C|nr:hypothetical protein [Aquimarina megaterium]
MKKKKEDSLSLKFDKQQISKLTSFKGKSIDYVCAHGIMGGDGVGASHTCGGESQCWCDTQV